MATPTRGVAGSVTVEKASRQRPRQGDTVDYDRALQPPVPLEALLQLKDENAYHSSCIEAKVADSVGRGWRLEQEDDTEDQDDGANTADGEVENDADRITRQLTDQLRALTTGAGGRLSFRELVKQAVRDMDGCGVGAIEVSRVTNGGDIDGLYPMPAQTLFKVKDDDQLLVQIKGHEKVYFKLFGDPRDVSASTGKEGPKDDDDRANEVIVFEHYSGRSEHYGVPPWISVVPTIAELSAIRSYNIEWFGSGGTGDRLVHVSDDTSGESIAKNILQKLNEAKGKGHTTVVSWGGNDSKLQVEFMSQQEGKRDSQFRNGKQDLIAELLIGHQTPPYRVGLAIAGELGGNAAQEMLDSYRDGVVTPLREYAEDVLAGTLFDPAKNGIGLPGYVFRFVERDWADMEQEVARAEKAVDLALVTRNEGREMIGMERGEDPALDRYYYRGVPVEPAAATGVDALRELKASLEAVLQQQEGAPAAPGPRVRDSEDETDPQGEPGE